VARTKRREQQLRKQKVRKQLKIKGAELIISPKDPRSDIPAVNYSRFVRAIAERDSVVWDAILLYLAFFEIHHYKQLGNDAIKKLTEFFTLVFSAFGDENFVPQPDKVVALVQFGHIFQHLLALTGYRTSDAALRNCLLQQHNLPKILMLQGPRCDVQIDQSKIFDMHPVLASMWYNSYLLGISSPTKEMQQNRYRHLKFMDERWIPYTHQVTSTYFTCTYMCPEEARHCKGIMNSAFKKTRTWEFTNTKSNNERPHIAIITNKWHRNHAVYKSAGVMVEQLLPFADLTLIWTGPPDRVPDTIVKDYFKQVLYCYFKDNGDLVIPPEMRHNEFDMVYYTDIGMSNESIWLSNSRIAPIQAMGYGHPDTSGDNSEIDYFIGGDIEKDSTDQYSETMVLLPGLGQHPAWPTYERKNNYRNDDIVRVNCVWGPDKYNYTLLSVLQEINHEVARRLGGDGTLSTHELHLFGSPGLNRYAALPAFIADVKRLLPNAIVHSEQEYYDYMENAEMHDFSINSFPFGCYNVLVESLFLGLPFITICGSRFYNRAGMWLNDRVGMSDNNFESPRDMINRAADLITNPDLLKAQREHIANLDLKKVLFDENDYFLQAVQYILTHHPFTETKIIGESNDKAE